MKLLHFPTADTTYPPNKQVIKLLDGLMVSAKAGEIQTLFIVALNEFESPVSGWTDTEQNPYTLIGGIASGLREYQEGME